MKKAILFVVALILLSVITNAKDGDDYPLILRKNPQKTQLVLTSLLT